MTIFVRPVKEGDKEKFTEWYSKSDLFNDRLLQIPNIYMLCAFTKGKILGYLVVEIEKDYQALLRFVPNPEASELEKAASSFELTKQAIFLGYSGGLTKIYFQGSNEGTNRIASHRFNQLPAEESQHIFETTEYPVYLLNLKDLE